MIKKIFLGVLIIFIVIQFFHPQQNISTTVSPSDIGQHFAVPVNVHDILKKSCYDCHSNNTSYPWYNKVQPVAWWLANHVSEGKRELNFSEFASYPAKKQYLKLKSTINEIKEGSMPLNTYLWIHKNAILTVDQKTIIINWADSLSKNIKTKNNLPDEPQRQRQG